MLKERNGNFQDSKSNCRQSPEFPFRLRICPNQTCMHLVTHNQFEFTTTSLVTQPDPFSRLVQAMTSVTYIPHGGYVYSPT